MKFEKLKQLVIKDYTDFMEDMYVDGDMTPNEFKWDMEENTKDLNKCKDFDDLVGWYCQHGFDEEDAVEKLIGFLIEY